MVGWLQCVWPGGSPSYKIVVTFDVISELQRSYKMDKELVCPLPPQRTPANVTSPSLALSLPSPSWWAPPQHAQRWPLLLRLLVGVLPRRSLPFSHSYLCPSVRLTHGYNRHNHYLW